MMKKEPLKHPVEIRVQKPYPIYDQNGQNRYPIYDQNGWKTIPFGAAYTYIVHIREYPTGGGGREALDEFSVRKRIVSKNRFSVD